MTVIMVCVVTVMFLIWLLLGSWIGYCSAGIWVIYTGAKSGCKLVTLFGGYSYDGVSAGIWVIHTDRCQIWVQTGDAFWRLLL